MKTNEELIKENEQLTARNKELVSIIQDITLQNEMAQEYGEDYGVIPQFTAEEIANYSMVEEMKSSNIYEDYLVSLTLTEEDLDGGRARKLMDSINTWRSHEAEFIKNRGMSEAEIEKHLGVTIFSPNKNIDDLDNLSFFERLAFAEQ